MKPGPVKPGLPKVFMVGAGPVATSLAGALAAAGVPVLGLWGRTPATLSAAAALAQVPGYSSPQPPVDQVREAEIVVLAVRDAAISEVAAGLLATGHLASRPVLLHCSGSMSAARAFTGVAEHVAGIGLLHPLRALARGVVVKTMSGTTFGVQGDVAGRAAAESLCAALGGRILSLTAEQMPGYHAAAAMASNYIVALMDVAAALLEAEGVDPEVASSAFLELAAGALQNVQSRGLPNALTGPIRRGDRPTVAGHLQAIDKSLPAASDLYRELGVWTVGLARRCGDASEAELCEITEMLGGRGKDSGDR